MISTHMFVPWYMNELLCAARVTTGEKRCTYSDMHESGVISIKVLGITFCVSRGLEKRSEGS